MYFSCVAKTDIFFSLTIALDVNSNYKGSWLDKMSLRLLPETPHETKLLVGAWNNEQFACNLGTDTPDQLVGEKREGTYTDYEDTIS